MADENEPFVKGQQMTLDNIEQKKPPEIPAVGGSSEKKEAPKKKGGDTGKLESNALLDPPKKENTKPKDGGTYEWDREKNRQADDVANVPDRTLQTKITDEVSYGRQFGEGLPGDWPKKDAEPKGNEYKKDPKNTRIEDYPKEEGASAEEPGPDEEQPDEEPQKEEEKPEEEPKKEQEEPKDEEEEQLETYEEHMEKVKADKVYKDVLSDIGLVSIDAATHGLKALDRKYKAVTDLAIAGLQGKPLSFASKSVDTMLRGVASASKMFDDIGRESLGLKPGVDPSKLEKDLKVKGIGYYKDRKRAREAQKFIYSAYNDALKRHAAGKDITQLSDEDLLNIQNEMRSRFGAQWDKVVNIPKDERTMEQQVFAESYEALERSIRDQGYRVNRQKRDQQKKLRGQYYDAREAKKQAEAEWNSVPNMVLRYNTDDPGTKMTDPKEHRRLMRLLTDLERSGQLDTVAHGKETLDKLRGVYGAPAKLTGEQLLDMYNNGRLADVRERGRLRRWLRDVPGGQLDKYQGAAKAKRILDYWQSVRSLRNRMNNNHISLGQNWIGKSIAPFEDAAGEAGYRLENLYDMSEDELRQVLKDNPDLVSPAVRYARMMNAVNDDNGHLSRSYPEDDSNWQTRNKDFALGRKLSDIIYGDDGYYSAIGDAEPEETPAVEEQPADDKDIDEMLNDEYEDNSLIDEEPQDDAGGQPANTEPPIKTGGGSGKNNTMIDPSDPYTEKDLKIVKRNLKAYSDRYLELEDDIMRESDPAERDKKIKEYLISRYNHAIAAIRISKNVKDREEKLNALKDARDRWADIPYDEMKNLGGGQNKTIAEALYNRLAGGAPKPKAQKAAASEKEQKGSIDSVEAEFNDVLQNDESLNAVKDLLDLDDSEQRKRIDSLFETAGDGPTGASEGEKLTTALVNLNNKMDSLYKSYIDAIKSGKQPIDGSQWVNRSDEIKGLRDKINKIAHRFYTASSEREQRKALEDQKNEKISQSKRDFEESSSRLAQIFEENGGITRNQKDFWTKIDEIREKDPALGRKIENLMERVDIAREELGEQPMYTREMTRKEREKGLQTPPKDENAKVVVQDPAKTPAKKTKSASDERKEVMDFVNQQIRIRNPNDLNNKQLATEIIAGLKEQFGYDDEKASKMYSMAMRKRTQKKDGSTKLTHEKDRNAENSFVNNEIRAGKYKSFIENDWDNREYEVDGQKRRLQDIYADVTDGFDTPKDRKDAFINALKGNIIRNSQDKAIFEDYAEYKESQRGAETPVEASEPVDTTNDTTETAEEPPKADKSEKKHGNLTYRTVKNSKGTNVILYKGPSGKEYSYVGSEEDFKYDHPDYSMSADDVSSLLKDYAGMQFKGNKGEYTGAEYFDKTYNDLRKKKNVQVLGRLEQMRELLQKESNVNILAKYTIELEALNRIIALRGGVERMREHNQKGGSRY